ncbi:ubiquitin carboxyl-terminal hydrolase 45 [Fopius arisanus]|uniref:Ubiquitin carboxyl-terminal hydrolase n=1 Tax=Fopius arisanus TaxID=64838 RepID=A0A0C9R710_9HYME|nr:PREDICTED: ubiquitin carboxyl-terminal hydrolase 45 [Fopius arisanus]XP_011305199.1 PREDICTED: ubiquitin carboxyl-terminal hydrolase 45 [Fopius arisanus]XP_011305200.1 PREDICTED: ubiquitin carboxyl-terminal hydrolase 45 [Fopius arisanus]XP_011305201.1 PREDICTED: ubiquitin carboxyl-terminal hydrolase 45 [Fopius arisanus]
MGKRKNRQPDVNDDASIHSSESGEDNKSDGPKCPHVMKSINMNALRKVLKKVGIQTECATCSKVDTNKIEVDDDDGMTPLIQPLWICLKCGNQACGRSLNEHAEHHFRTPHSDSHCLAIDTHRWSIWCYACEDAVKADSRKQLLEIVEFIKKLATTTYTSPQPAIPSPCAEKPHESIPSTKEKQLPLTSLTRVVGLVNLGNTCFFNSVLQCLAQTPFLVKVLEDLREPDVKFVLPGGKCKPSDDAEEMDLPPIEGKLEGWGNFTATLWKTLTDMQSSDSNQAYRPSELLNSFKKKSSQCMDGGQHDSHELLRHLLEHVRNDDVRRYQAIILKKIGLDDKIKRQAIDGNLKAQVKFYGNQACARHLGSEPVFRGVLVSTLECLDCHHSSQRTEPFLDLSLPVLMDKPQPPVVGKRRNSGLEDSFDLMGNTSGPSKYQLKKGKKPARRNRQNDYTNINKSGVSRNNVDQASQAESEESDADVEDNIENDGASHEVIESGYSSEKVSTVTSPVSPGEPCGEDELKTQNSLREISMYNSGVETLESRLNNPSLEMNLEGPVSSASEALPDLSPSTSLIVNSEMSPGATGSPLSSPITSKSPTSSSQERLTFTLVINDGPEVEDRKDKSSRFSEAETDECRSEAEDPLKKLTAVEMRNGMNEVTSGMGNMSVSNQSPTSYQVASGECSIQSCLNQFTARELMSGSNKVGCEACTARENKEKKGKMVCTSSTKQYLVSRVPAVLILHLKRFQSQRFGFRKVTKHVAFPMILDLAPVCKCHDRAKIYSLYGVVEHSGTLHGGHYVAYVKARQPLQPDDPRWAFLPKARANDGEEVVEPERIDPQEKIQPPPGRWYYVSDSRVMEIDEASVLQREAYLLFYERIL